jgi:hypothetical protein
VTLRRKGSGPADPRRKGAGAADPRRKGPGAADPRRKGAGAADSRRALSHVGGRVEGLLGPAELTSVIRRCLSIDAERGVRDHVHGFHSYPARLHPATAGALITGLTQPGQRVGDPFCGSGTVVVEALRLGRRALAVDLNPLAARLARFKTRPLSAAQRSELQSAARRVCEVAEQRREAGAGPTRRYADDERAQFDVHVLLELDGLAAGVRAEPQGILRQALLLALSSIFSKVTRPPAHVEGPAKRIAGGFTIRFFEGRVRELCRQLAESQRLLPSPAPESECIEGDARALSTLGVKDVDLFVTSPPYPGVLDYADYHRTRLRWLDLDGRRFDQLEMGSRRALQKLEHRQAVGNWERDFAAALSGMRGALSVGGRAVLVVADSMLAGRPYFADQMVERCAEQAGLRVVARGSQRRPHFHRQSALAFGKRPRREHLLVLAPR